jgi:transcription-repair coupling factor (superfamily II helicase)
MSRTVEMLGFMAPGLTVIPFPAWDCLPYDRASPHRDILARRIDALTRLSAIEEGARARLVIVTTVAAILQRVPAPSEFKAAALELKRGGQLDQAKLVDYLVGKGYARTGTVGEPGEFAVRGGIVDLFPPGTSMPIRIDFFGDEIEDLRLFDPLSQRSLGKIDDFALKPINEIELSPAAIERFRTNYRSEFGTSGADDPLYEAISAGRQYPGMEHWLPLFGTELVPFEAYLPRAIVTLDHQMDEAVKARLEMIQDFHQARRDLQAAERESGAPVYRPLPVGRLYIGENAWREFTEKRVTFALHPFQAPDEGGWLNGFGRFGKSFAEARADPDINLYQAVANFTRSEQQQGRHVLLAAASTGALERIGHLLAEHGIGQQQNVEKWDDLRALPASTLARAVLSLSNGFIADGVTVLTEQDILGDRLIRTVAKRKKADAFLTELANFHAGDYVVHVDHGIGRYEGLVTLDVGGAPHDCLRVIYDGGDKLFVPVENIDVLSRYGGEEAIVALDKLGGAAWQARKARVKQRIRDIAEQLMKTAAMRQVKSADVLQPAAGSFDEFCARFP